MMLGLFEHFYGSSKRSNQGSNLDVDGDSNVGGQSGC